MFNLAGRGMQKIRLNYINSDHWHLLEYRCQNGATLSAMLSFALRGIMILQEDQRLATKSSFSLNF